MILHPSRLATRVLLAATLALSLVAGPALVAPTAPVVASATAAASTYTVVAGDTLNRVSFRTGVRYTTIASLNGLTHPYTLRVGQVLRLDASAAPAPPAPAFAAKVPASTSQVVRTVRTNRWCSQAFCSVTELWSKTADGRWTRGASYRSQIGPTGFIDGTRRIAGDKTTPAGVYDVETTFSTDASNPGIDMPWKRRLPTSTVTGNHRYYNTWIEEEGRTDGNRAAMRWGLWIGYNNPRLVPDQGPAPDTRRGSGIFMHTMGPAARYWASEGCVAIGDPAQMRAVLLWLDEDRDPRIVNGI